MADFKYFDQIEAYLNKSMPEAERANFEEALTQDEVLQKEYQAYQATLIASDILGLQVLEEMSKEQKPRVIPMRRWWMMAAAILVLLVSGMLIFSNLNYRTTVLFSEAIETSSIDFSNTQDQNVQNAWQAYQRADYNTTLQLLSPSRNDASFANEDAQLLYAYTLIQQDNTQAAIPLLTGMSEANPEAKWYLALAYLQNDQKSDAKVLLEELSANPSNPYAERASRLLRKVNSFWSVFAF